MKYGNKVLIRINSALIGDLYTLEINKWTRQNAKEIAEELQKDLDDIHPIITGAPFKMIKHLIIILK